MYKLKKLIKKIKTRVGQDFIYKLGSLKTRKVLGWKPKYTLKKGLKEVIMYHNNNFIQTSKKNLFYNDKSLSK